MSHGSSPKLKPSCFIGFQIHYGVICRMHKPLNLDSWSCRMAKCGATLVVNDNPYDNSQSSVVVPHLLADKIYAQVESFPVVPITFACTLRPSRSTCGLTYSFSSLRFHPSFIDGRYIGRKGYGRFRSTWESIVRREDIYIFIFFQIFPSSQLRFIFLL